MHRERARQEEKALNMLGHRRWLVLMSLSMGAHSYHATDLTSYFVWLVCYLCTWSDEFPGNDGGGSSHIQSDFRCLFRAAAVSSAPLSGHRQFVAPKSLALLTADVSHAVNRKWSRHFGSGWNGTCQMTARVGIRFLPHRSTVFSPLFFSAFIIDSIEPLTDDVRKSIIKRHFVRALFRPNPNFIRADFSLAGLVDLDSTFHPFHINECVFFEQSIGKTTHRKTTENWRRNAK